MDISPESSGKDQEIIEHMDDKSFTRVGEALVLAQTRARQADERAERYERVLKTILRSPNLDLSLTSNNSVNSAFINEPSGNSAMFLHDSLNSHDWDLLESLLYQRVDHVQTLSLHEGHDIESDESFSNQDIDSMLWKDHRFSDDENDITVLSKEVLEDLRKQVEFYENYEIPRVISTDYKEDTKSISSKLHIFYNTILERLYQLSGPFISLIQKHLPVTNKKIDLRELVLGIFMGFFLGIWITHRAFTKQIASQDYQLHTFASQVCRLQAFSIGSQELVRRHIGSAPFSTRYPIGIWNSYRSMHMMR